MSRRKTPSCAGSSDDNSFAWPSTAGILETPDRKRPRRSIDTTCSDYGLSTSFGSPESHQVPPSTSPLLKTPVQPGKSCIHLTPSPLSSFRVRQSVSGSLKLSNPNNATEVRFTGSSLARLSPVKIGQFNKSTSNGRPLAPIQSNASRCLNDTFRMDDSAYNSCNESSLLFDSFRDNRRRSSILETPSKLFKINQMSYEPNSSDLFFSTSTPVKACNFSIYRSNYIAEQPSGRLETCVTDNSDFMISPTRYLDPSPIKPPKPVEKIPVIAQSVARKLYPKEETTKPVENKSLSLACLLDDFDPFLSNSDRDLLQKAGYEQTAVSFPKPLKSSDSKPSIRGPFAGKKKQLKPIFTSIQIRQACADTPDTYELIGQARRYLQARPDLAQPAQE